MRALEITWLLLLSCSLAPGLYAEVPATIRSILISGNTRTRTAVIRRELLFAEGDALDTARVAETARNLRRLLFLGDVDYRIEGRQVDVSVRVQDLYSRAVTPLLSGDRDELTYGATGLDYNFLGKGQVVKLTVEHDAVAGNRGEVYYRVPRVGDSRWGVTGQAAIGAEGHLTQATVSRPYHSLAVKLAGGATVYSTNRVRRLYSGGALSAKYTDRLAGGSLWYGRSYGQIVKVRPGIRLSISDRRFEPEPGYTYAPGSRRRVLPSLGLVVWRPHFETTRYVGDLGRLEDLQMGSWVAGRAGLSLETLGSDTNFAFGSIEMAPRFKPSATAYTFSSFRLSARYVDGGYSNLICSAEVRTVVRIGKVHTVAFRARWDAIDRPEDNTQLLLGAFRGLRGYVPRRFDGSRRFLMNLEARPTLRRRPSYVLAGALFLDAGSAWTPGRSTRSVSTSAGTGLRVALPRLYASPILRSDLAYAFRDRAWQLWVGLGQYF